MGSSQILGMIDDGEARRTSQRRRVMLTARLSTSSSSEQVRLRDVSATGARVEGRHLPSLGAPVLLTRGNFSAYGQLVWKNGEVGGVRFDQALDEDSILDALKGLPPASQESEPYRRPGLNRTAHAPYSDGSGWIDLPRPPRG
jgi:hypothetical protein